MALGACAAFACQPGRQHMSDLYEVRCKECGKTWGNSPRSFCEECFSPLEVSFDYDSIKKSVRREDLASRKFNMWRYAEFLPLQDSYTVRGDIGGTPLVAPGKLAAHWRGEKVVTTNKVGGLALAFILSLAGEWSV